ncbi:hypothetical protein NE237_027060 [Protea cynaroides]|uniref:Uncharacterized protein n=1 Tax=Protea cynaroides TaxID=273540 RepID=A0A9Q0GPF0_9MAGN|nr:hypothetical protein NE237_027060 [Protea cynaroides]
MGIRGNGNQRRHISSLKLAKTMYIEYMLEEQGRYLGADPSVSSNLPCSFASVSICRQHSSLYLETGMPTPLSPSLFTVFSLCPIFLVSLFPSSSRFMAPFLSLFLLHRSLPTSSPSFALNLPLFTSSPSSALNLPPFFSAFSRSDPLEPSLSPCSSPRPSLTLFFSDFYPHP